MTSEVRDRSHASHRGWTRRVCVAAAALVMTLAGAAPQFASAQSAPTGKEKVAIVPSVGATGPPVVTHIRAVPDTQGDLEITLADPTLTSSAGLEIVINMGLPEGERWRTVAGFAGGEANTTVEHLVDNGWAPTGAAAASVVGDGIVQIGRPTTPQPKDAVWIQLRRTDSGIADTYITPLFDAQGLFDTTGEGGPVASVGWIRDSLGAIRGSGSGGFPASVSQNDRNLAIITSTDRPEKIGDRRVANITDEVRFYGPEPSLALSLQADQTTRRVLAFHPPDTHPLDNSGKPTATPAGSLPPRAARTWRGGNPPTDQESGSDGELFDLDLGEATSGTRLEIGKARLETLLGAPIGEAPIAVRRVFRLEDGTTLTLEGLAAPLSSLRTETTPGTGGNPGSAPANRTADPGLSKKSKVIVGACALVLLLLLGLTIRRFWENTAWHDHRVESKRRKNDPHFHDLDHDDES